MDEEAMGIDRLGGAGEAIMVQVKYGPGPEHRRLGHNWILRLRNDLRQPRQAVLRPAPGQNPS
jgi:hypothetical protein